MAGEKRNVVKMTRNVIYEENEREDAKHLPLLEK